MNKESSLSVDTGLVGLLTILFVGLKLTHYIDWSWWWVLSPLWIVAIISLLLILVLLYLKSK